VKAVWLARHIRSQVKANRWIVLCASAAFCLLALVAGGATLGARTVSRWGAFVGQNVHVIVYLADDVDQDRARDLAELLRRVPTVAQVTTVEPASALARLGASATAFGLDGKALDGLEPAYFPRSLEVSLAPAADLSERASDLAKRLRPVPGVLQVDAMGSGLDRLSVWVKLGRKLGAIVLAAMAIVTLGILVAVFLRSRSAAAGRAAVLVQLGETASGIRLPASLWMAAASAVGGGTGALVLALGWQPFVSRLERNLGIVSAPPFPSLNRFEIATGFALVLLVGLAMGYFATPLPRTQGRA
jgi:cell division protein FtsX